MLGFLTRLRSLSSVAKFRLYSTPVPSEVHLQIQIQDVLNGRYKILQCLGRGQEATVWLAQDATAPRKNVAIKVLTDHVTSLQNIHAFELRVMERISHLPPTHPGVPHLLSLHDHFTSHGPQNSEHLCIVNDALGPSILDLQSSVEGHRLSSAVVKHVTRQLLRALQALHDCNTVHTDIKMDNILFRIPEDSFDTEHVLKGENAVLIDYGTAMPLESHPDRLIQPEALRSPEVLLGCPWNTKADIWNLGCIVFELLTGQRLFRPRPIVSYSAEQYHLARIFGTLVDNHEIERLASYFSHGLHYTTFFNERHGLRLSIGSDHRESLQRILEIYNVYDAALLELLMAMLRVHPDDRPTAAQLENFSWFDIQ
ncbi:kinase-like protein [Lentinula edodes]|uniref:Kinase-like protein n=1 Tax=Lentinula edodes TaxID=5353 RepID=A0A1Q3DWE3_LENED|nr:kinase-like protein [Lentinula edodes]